MLAIHFPHGEARLFVRLGNDDEGFNIISFPASREVIVIHLLNLRKERAESHEETVAQAEIGDLGVRLEVIAESNTAGSKIIYGFGFELEEIEKLSFFL